LKKYKHIFFDLDHTIWDFERNSKETLSELYEKYNLSSLGVPAFEIFIKAYSDRNFIMWDQYRQGIINKEILREKRFSYTLKDLGLNENLLPGSFATDYVAAGPTKTYLFPFVTELLDYLHSKYQLHIITNGFEEVQFIKLNSSGLEKYFKEIITSEGAGYKKPDRNIFYYSLNKSGASIDNSIMIGDSLESDIIGARDVGIDQVYFNPKGTNHSEKITYEIQCWSELKNIF
jgi:putative hydrolase of the HAD superfamily